MSHLGDLLAAALFDDDRQGRFGFDGDLTVEGERRWYLHTVRSVMSIRANS
jgi:hypothetical protein